MLVRSFLIISCVWTAFAVGADTDYSRHRELVPQEPYHRGEHRLSVGNCSFYMWGTRSIYAREAVTLPDGRPWHKIISIDLPRDISATVQWNSTQLTNKADITESTDRSITLNYDVTEYFRDTFGYYVREQITAALNPNGTLKSLVAKKLGSNHIFIAFGRFGAFKVEETIRCQE